MYSRAISLVSLLTLGCATRVPDPPPDDGYVRAKEVGGCCRMTEPRQYDVVLGTALDSALRSKLAGRNLEMPQCWYEEKRDQLVLMAGPVCEGYDEIHFQRVNGVWQLTHAERQDFVMCIERKR